MDSVSANSNDDRLTEHCSDGKELFASAAVVVVVAAVVVVLPGLASPPSGIRWFEATWLAKKRIFQKHTSILECRQWRARTHTRRILIVCCCVWRHHTSEVRFVFFFFFFFGCSRSHL